MNAPSEDIKDFLVAAGIGVYATTLWIGKEPKTPNKVMTVYDTGGFDQEASYEYERPTVQVRARGDVGEYLEARVFLLEAVDELHAKIGEDINETRYVQILQQGDILFVEWDESNRPVFTANFAIQRTSSPS